MQFQRALRIGTTTLIALLVLVSLAAASPTHWTTGTGGSESPTSHTNNPGHLWVVVKADHSGAITSGGRFHDRCVGSACQGAVSSWAADWALDIGGGGGQQAKLYLDLDGFAAGASPTPDNNRNMAVYAIARETGNFRNDPVNRPACSWQKFDIMVTYYDAANNKIGDRLAGRMWVAHITPKLAKDTPIPTGPSRQNPNGSGLIYYVNGVDLGIVYNNGDRNPATGQLYSDYCSSGPHTHVEFFSSHNWGGEYEWHSSQGPDGYNGLGNDHIHYGSSVTPSGNTNYTTPLVTDSVTQGVTVLGKIGGNTTSFYMMNNLNTGDH